MNLIPTEKREKYLNKLQERNLIQGTKLEIQTKSGDKRIVISNSESIVFDSKIRFISFLYDVTERRKAQRQIEYHALLLRKVNDAVIGTDSNFRITYWNRGAELMYGYTETEARGKSSAELLRPTYKSGEREKIISELEHQGTSKAIISTKNRSGTEVIAEVNSTRMTDESGNTTGYVVVYRDITERKKTEESVKRQADLIELSFDAIIEGQLNGGIESWNRGAEELYGYSESEAIGNPIHKLLFTVFPVPWPWIEKELHEGGIWEGELKHRAKNGHEIIVSSKIQMITRDDGSQILLETNRDITERKRGEEVLQTTLKRFYTILSSMHASILLVSEE